MNECQCDLSGFCKVRNIPLKPTLQTLCKRNKPRIDAYLAGEKPPCKKEPVSNVGTRLLTSIEKSLGRKITCGTCKTIILGLNLKATHDYHDVCAAVHREIGGSPEWNGEGRQVIEDLVSQVIPRPPDFPDNPPMTFVWPYFHPAARGDELRWSIRSVLHHYGPTASVLVIGDKPDWYSGPYIPQPRIAPCANREYRDMNEKMITLSRHELVPDEFVWMMDDVYFIRPMTLDNLKTPRAVQWNQSTSNRWRRVKHRTMQLLIQEGLPTHDYATHLPHHAEKAKLVEVIRRYDMFNRTLLWEVLYGNTFRPTPSLPYNVLHVHQMNRQFVNPGNAYVLNNLDTAWGPRLHKWLSVKFPHKTEHEV